MWNFRAADSRKKAHRVLERKPHRDTLQLQRPSGWRPSASPVIFPTWSRKKPMLVPYGRRGRADSTLTTRVVFKASLRNESGISERRRDEALMAVSGNERAVTTPPAWRTDGEVYKPF